MALINCAQDKTRTCTPLQAPAPQAGVSTNSTTWASGCKDKKPFDISDMKNMLQ